MVRRAQWRVDLPGIGTEHEVVRSRLSVDPDSLAPQLGSDHTPHTEGVPVMTIRRGEVAFEDGKVLAAPGSRVHVPG